MQLLIIEDKHMFLYLLDEKKKQAYMFLKNLVENPEF
jgi:hypothetical protein